MIPAAGGPKRDLVLAEQAESICGCRPELTDPVSWKMGIPDSGLWPVSASFELFFVKAVFGHELVQLAGGDPCDLSGILNPSATFRQNVPKMALFSCLCGPASDLGQGL